eukprot:sb/3467286/
MHRCSNRLLGAELTPFYSKYSNLEDTACQSDVDQFVWISLLNRNKTESSLLYPSLPLSISLSLSFSLSLSLSLSHSLSLPLSLSLSLSLSLFSLTLSLTLSLSNPLTLYNPMHLFHKTIQPLFDLAGIESEVVYTEYSGHGRDYIKSCENLMDYTSIVTVSGDGIVFEVFNGLMKRDDWETAIKVPLSIIPGGSDLTQYNNFIPSNKNSLTTPAPNHVVNCHHTPLLSCVSAMTVLSLPQQNTCLYGAGVLRFGRRRLTGFALRSCQANALTTVLAFSVCRTLFERNENGSGQCSDSLGLDL